MTSTADWDFNDKPLNTVFFGSPSHADTLLSGLNSLRSKGHLLDVTLYAQGHAFQVSFHFLIQCVLGLYVFNALFVFRLTVPF